MPADTRSIEMDMNNRKAENRSDQKGLDIDIEEINNKFTISLGDLRTEIESAKWDATRRAISESCLPAFFAGPMRQGLGIMSRSEGGWALRVPL